MERIQRITLMEKRFDRALKTTRALQRALAAYDRDRAEIAELIAYYDSGLWRADYLADEAGQLPSELKRGVLSEDGIYNLLADLAALEDRLAGGKRDG